MGAGMRFRSLAVGTSLLSLAGLTGCFFPQSGPNEAVIDISNTSAVWDSSRLGYALVVITPAVVEALGEYEPAVLAGAFTDKRPPSGIIFGIGDVASVTIFEAAAGGLFIPIEAGVRPGNFVTLPDQIVDNNGNISVPYAGVIKAAGRSNVEIQNDIIARIQNRAIEPQVVVTQTQQRTQLVSVVGEVNQPVRYPAAASGAGDRITDAITRAGGIKGQGYESWVMLERKGRRATVPFANLVFEPKNNIYVQPGDRIYVYREQQKFLAFGASGQQGQFTFDDWRINLAQAVGKAGGLIDVQANPSSVFLYRREPRFVAERLGVDISRFGGDIIPVIFRVSFSDPTGYFLATKVQMRSQDVVYAANAMSVDLSKFLNFVNNVSVTGSNALIFRSNVVSTVQNNGTSLVIP
jgi:polysaccharide biosynthesis/export protein